MRGTSISVDLAAELEKRIERAKKNKSQILGSINFIKEKCLKKIITYSEYEQLLNKKRNGRSLSEWVEHYDEYIELCKSMLNRESRTRKIKKIIYTFILLASFLILLTQSSFLKPIFVGFTIEEERISHTQDLNLVLSSSGTHTLIVEPGQLTYLKLTGKIEGEGTVKIYLEDLLALDSSNLLSSETPSLESKITGFAAENEEPPALDESYSQKEAPQTVASPSEEEPLSEASQTPEEAPKETPEETAEEAPTEEENVPEAEQPTQKTIKEFNKLCEETCALPESFNKTEYVLRIKIENAELTLESIEYEVRIQKEAPEENITAPVIETNITTNATEASVINETLEKPQIILGQPVKWVRKIQTDKPGKIKIKLPKQAEDITVNKITTLPEEPKALTESYSQEEAPQTVASPSEEEPLSETNQTAEEQTETNQTTEETEINTTAQEIKQPAISTLTGLTITSEKTSEKSFFGKIINFFRNIFSRTTGRAITETAKEEYVEITIEDSATEYEIEYYTDAPQAVEETTSGGKRIIVSAPDELNYTDVLAFTVLENEVPANSAKLYHIINNSKEQVNITEYDNNNNNLTDYIEWIVPHLSNQTYELEIIILNVKSHPIVGGNWTVDFVTKGTADLTITAYNGTQWSNTQENLDLKFLEVKCGQQTITSQWIETSPRVFSVVIENYECNETSSEISKALTQGFHTLEFDFGGIKAYAYNTAGILNLQIVGSINGYNSSVILATLDEATSGYDVYDVQSSPPPTNSSEFYSNITAGAEYHLSIDSWNDTVNPREIFLIYYLSEAQTGTLQFDWSALTENYTGNFTYYKADENYTTPVAEVDMRNTATYSDSITSLKYIYAKITINEYNGSSINMTFPEDANYTSTSLDLNYTFDSSYPDSCWHSNDTGETNSTPQACGANWTGVNATEGTNTWIVYINDTSGALNSSSVTFNVDTTAPTITSVSPINATTYTTTTIDFNVSLSEDGTWCGFSLDDSENITMTELNATYFNFTNDSMTDGIEHNVTFVCNDTLGNMNSTMDMIYFTVNVASPVETSPFINFTPPTPGNGTQQSFSSVEINVSVSDDALVNLTYNWNGTNYTMLDNSLVFFMNFDNVSALGESETKAVDLINGNNGTPGGNAAPTTGIYGGAYVFDGTNDNITINDATAFDIFAGQFSVAIWIKSSTSTDKGHIIGQYNSGGLPRWALRIKDSAALNTTGPVFYENAAAAKRCSGVTNIADGNWHYVVAAGTAGSTCQIYVDGKFDNGGSNTLDANFNANGYALTFGEEQTGADDIAATLDEAMMWNRELSADEIQQLYMSNLYKFNNSDWVLYVNQTYNTTDGLSEGNYTYQAFKNNITGDMDNTDERSIEITTLAPEVDNAPTVILNSPADLAGLTSTSVDFNCTATDDINLTNVTLYGNWSTGWHANNTNSSEENATDYIFTVDIPDGMYYWTCEACDNTSQCTSAASNFTFSIDSIFPLIEFVEPTPPNADTTENNSVEINVSIVGSDISDIIYNWNGTNFSIYDNLRVGFNFDNNSDLEECDDWYCRIYDFSPYGNHGNLSNISGNDAYGDSINESQLPEWNASGKHGGAFDFKVVNSDVAGASIHIPHSDSLNPYSDDFAMMMWLKCEYALDSDLSRKGSTNTIFAGEGWYKMEVGGYSVANLISLQFNTDNDDATLEYNESICDGNWHFAVGQRRGTGAELWIDGVNITTFVAAQSDATVAGSISNTANLSIGSKDTQNDDFFNGSLDEYRLYINRSFTEEEILFLYFSNLNKYDTDKWAFYTNQTKNLTDLLDDGDYTYYASAKDITGNVNSTEERTITIGAAANNVPEITYITNLTNIMPEEGTYIDVEFEMTVYDADGSSDINTTITNASFSRGDVTRANSSCTTTGSNDTEQNFSCTIDMWYFDENGEWNISVYAEDNSSVSATNSSPTFTYDLLQAIKIDPDTIYWDPLLPGGTNQIPPAGNFTMINNTGNANLSGSIAINGTDLSDGSNTFDVENFTADVDEGAAACTGGINLSHSTNVTLNDIILSRGNLSTGIEGNASLYYCIPLVPTSLPSGAYSTLTAGSWWEIKIEAIFLALFSIQYKRKKRKLNIEKEPLVASLSIITQELTETYTQEKQELAKLLAKEIKDKYRLTNKQLSSLTPLPRTIPLNIFSAKLGALEAITKYLKENLNLSYIKISAILNRNQRTIWTAYHKSQQKNPKPLKSEGKTILLAVFKNKKLTVLESLILQLRKQNLKYVEIAKLLNRDQRNIWTIYSRAIVKLKKQEKAS